MRYLLDTNTVIQYLNASFPTDGMKFLHTIVDTEPIASVITKMETLGFNFPTTQEQTIVETFINGSSILNLSDDIVNKTIDLRKLKKVKLPDAIIAATALVHGLVIITNNTSDFKNIIGLQVVNPHDMV